MPRKKNSGKKQGEQGRKGGVAMQSSDQIHIHPMVGAAVGAAVGSVVGAATAVILSDKDTRARVREVALSLKDQAADRFHEMNTTGKHAAESAKKDVQDKISAEMKKKSE